MRHTFSLFIIISFCFACSNPPKVEKSKNPTFLKAYKFRDAGNKDSAFIYYNKAKEELLQEKDSLNAAVCMINMAIIASDKSDYLGAQELSLSASSFLDDSNPGHFKYNLSNYNALGISSFSLKQYDKAIEFYNKSLEFTSDSALIISIRSNVAENYRKSGKYDDAILIFKSLVSQEKNPVDYARILTNYASTKWLQNPSYNASTELRQGLSIRIKEKDKLGENNSYDHLTDFYLKTHPDSALYFAKQWHEMVYSLDSPGDLLECLKKLVLLSDEQNSKKYFAQYRQLSDSLQTVKNNAKNQFALIRYETEKHKANNLLLQREATIRTIWIFSLSLLLVGGSFLSIIWYKKRKKRMELEAKNAIQEGQLKTSKKVHDVVANGIYQIMTEIENNKEIIHEHILDKMESLYERSRDISYDVLAKANEDNSFENTIRELLVSFASEETKVIIVGNTNELWKHLPYQDQFEIKQVLQELMVNMRKHSRATQVAIRFELKDDKIFIYYTDNGIGISDGIKFKNGLTNTGNRINSINGNINFGTSTRGGLNVQLIIPITV
ncbi:ATP-binding protein [Daejeonella sp.]|jgi:tetratricopeptide (TPR) repeat protein|uniref:tetratricopeptide repeat-containing sensor histidine kinase n=1 Tax=Daejeonella sp. TaxID=2805397 RepID=UPI0037BF6591